MVHYCTAINNKHSDFKYGQGKYSITSLLLKTAYTYNTLIKNSSVQFSCMYLLRKTIYQTIDKIFSESCSYKGCLLYSISQFIKQTCIISHNKVNSIWGKKKKFGVLENYLVKIYFCTYEEKKDVGFLYGLFSFKFMALLFFLLITLKVTILNQEKSSIICIL